MWHATLLEVHTYGACHSLIFLPGMAEKLLSHANRFLGGLPWDLAGGGYGKRILLLSPKYLLRATILPPKIPFIRRKQGRKSQDYRFKTYTCVVPTRKAPEDFPLTSLMTEW
jgi:hypothetical protein